MTRRILVTMLAGLALAGTAGARTDAPDKNPMKTPPETPVGDTNFTVVNTDDIRLVTDEIENHLQRALEHADPADAARAARDLRKAAGGVRMEAARAPDRDRPRLTAASDSLEALAARIERAPFWSETSIRGAAAVTHLSLAWHFCRLARSSWAAHDAPATGREMEDAVDHVGRAVEWRAVGLPTAVVSRLMSIRSGAVTMQTDDTGWDRDQVAPALADLQAAIDRLEAGPPAPGTKG